MNQEEYELEVHLRGLIRQYDQDPNDLCLAQMVQALAPFDRRSRVHYQQLHKLLGGKKSDLVSAKTALTAIWVLSVGGEFSSDLRALIGQAADRIQNKFFPPKEKATA